MNRLARTITVLLLTSYPFLGCATMPSEPFLGQVVEEGTSQPIPGAIVVGRWQETRSSIVDAHTVCVHVESATSDAQGNYQLPRYKGREPTLVDAYKSGYERSADIPLNEAFYKRGQYLLRPFVGGRGERLAYLSRRAVSCSDKHDIEIKLLPLYKALYQEASSIAVTKDEKIKVLHHLKDIERLELGSTKAWENFQLREQELK